MKPVSELLRKREDTTLWHVRPEDTVYAALELLEGYETGALMVMDEGRLVGVFSERDYTRKIALKGRNSRETPVREIMTSQVVSVGPKTGTRECMALMSEKRIRHLPVLDGGRIIGVLSVGDLVKAVIEMQQQTIQQLESYIHS
ncbi:MAG: CBS domain-containing protein [Burkholderiales bacterium]|nr:CBS domain-containing protein [Burkholderiales bacterium]